jgi:tetratricopeptide (TPR) repeat protein
MALRSLLLIASLTATAGTAGAQACVIETGKPAQLAGARRYINLIGGGDRQSEKPNHLRSGSRVLVEQTEKIDNQIGRFYLLGKLYAIWLGQEVATPVTTRGFLTLEGDPNAPVDLYAEIDAAFDKVESLNPACADSTRPYRMTVFGRVFNKALEARQAGQFDSAETMALRALVVNPKSTAAWNLIAAARDGRKDAAGYQAALAKVIEIGESDPDGIDARKAAMYNLGVLKLNEAMAMQGGDQTARAKEAEGLFRQYLALAPGSAEATTGLSRALRVLGDSSGVSGIFQGMLNDAAKFTAGQLFEAGVGAAGADDWAMSSKLIEAGLTKNPYSRDALFNLTNAYLTLEEGDKMLAAVNRLLDLDPSGRTNLRLKAGAFQRVAKNSTDEKLKTAAQDSIVAYLSKYEAQKFDMRPQFQPVAGGAKLLGRITNLGDAPASFTVNVEFLDAKGAVVTTGSATVPNIGPTAFQEFEIEGKGAGIVAYRYKPIG